MALSSKLEDDETDRAIPGSSPLPRGSPSILDVSPEDDRWMTVFYEVPANKSTTLHLNDGYRLQVTTRPSDPPELFLRIHHNGNVWSVSFFLEEEPSVPYGDGTHAQLHVASPFNSCFPIRLFAEGRTQLIIDPPPPPPHSAARHLEGGQLADFSVPLQPRITDTSSENGSNDSDTSDTSGPPPLVDSDLEGQTHDNRHCSEIEPDNGSSSGVGLAMAELREALDDHFRLLWMTLKGLGKGGKGGKGHGKGRGKGQGKSEGQDDNSGLPLFHHGGPPPDLRQTGEHGFIHHRSSILARTVSRFGSYSSRRWNDYTPDSSPDARRPQEGDRNPQEDDIGSIDSRLRYLF